MVLRLVLQPFFFGVSVSFFSIFPLILFFMHDTFIFSLSSILLRIIYLLPNRTWISCNSLLHLSKALICIVYSTTVGTGHHWML
jgi:hypothetical protein